MDEADRGDGGQATDALMPKRTRERSTIEFPYADLEAIVEMIRKMHDRAGTQCEDVQLAAWLNQTASGGGFRSRLSAGRMFGLLETNGAQVTITPMGLDSLDDDRGPASRAEAFLRVELFRQMYEQYKGYALPPPGAIEKQIENMGVAPKQKDRARQTFIKSAQYAGYIDGQTGRFTKPAFAAVPRPTESNEGKKPDEGNGDGDLPPGLHPFIVGLLHELPAAKTSWSVDKRADWLTAAATMFKLIYTGDGSITVTVEGGPKKSGVPEAEKDNDG